MTYYQIFLKGKYFAQVQSYFVQYYFKMLQIYIINSLILTLFAFRILNIEMKSIKNSI